MNETSTVPFLPTHYIVWIPVYTQAFLIETQKLNYIQVDSIINQSNNNFSQNFVNWAIVTEHKITVN